MQLKKYLYKKRLTPLEFSDISNVPLKTIYRLLKAKTSSSMKNAIKIADSTNNEVTIEELIDIGKD